MKVFNDTGNMTQSAHFGWQNEDMALYGLREGYKNSADELVEIVLKNGSDTRKLDTYVFPIVFLYRHSIEISLKHIYFRAYGVFPKGRHDLLTLWKIVEEEVINKFISSDDFVEQIRKCKKRFIKYSLNGISLSKFKLLIQELQEANQRDAEVNLKNAQADIKAQVWRYLMSVDGELFFKYSHSIDYVSLKESMDYMYETLDFIYVIIDDYFSS